MGSPIFNNPDKDAAARLLHAAGWSDARIATAFGCCPNSIYNWRKAKGLRRDRQGRPAKIDDAEARRLHSEGWSDGAIARHFGCLQSAATHWRHRRGLARNMDPNPRPSDEQVAAAREAFLAGHTKDQVRREVGIGQRAADKIRRALGEQHGPIKHNLERVIFRPMSDPIYRRLNDAVRRGIPDDLRDDIISDMYLDLLDGTLEPEDIESAAPRYTGSVYRSFASRWGPKSLDEPISEDGFTRKDMLACDRAAAWLEEIGATV